MTQHTRHVYKQDNYQGKLIGKTNISWILLLNISYAHILHTFLSDSFRRFCFRPANLNKFPYRNLIDFMIPTLLSRRRQGRQSWYHNNSWLLALSRQNYFLAPHRRNTTDQDRQLGPHLLTRINWMSIEFNVVWISRPNYTHMKQWFVITHPCPRFNGNLIYRSSYSMDKQVIISHMEPLLLFVSMPSSQLVPWWRHQNVSTSLALCEGKSPVTGEFSS